MFYPLTVRDFLDRAETVYPDRVGIVDEPDQPAPSLGSLTYRQVAANAWAQATRQIPATTAPHFLLTVVTSHLDSVRRR